eukprot:CAMPEP_0174331292 /NCGR_PEP_ID=MMETSP0810-20121108/17379_1 /TAXON_ID=73025 ORGANISM="Eutreptiella gymnastica-like, Strain CCMP1594" /NCGR_SAMPLE_ID=MMETSP0810 /ASSEMBLY_ACC=CAM_ASM_000659 /LENGTH=75 /DNA_ID=CAMNT_0015447009 /DNA_START=214 /DNA_END=438 /DNA_ORIENTATION=-
MWAGPAGRWLRRGDVSFSEASHGGDSCRFRAGWRRVRAGLPDVTPSLFGRRGTRSLGWLHPIPPPKPLDAGHGAR